MNLNAIAGPLIAAVNPPMIGTIKVSAGYTTSADFSRTPVFVEYPGVSMQVQAMTGRDLEKLDGLNIQGILRAVYMNGTVEGLDRPAGKGGDILSFNGSDWLVVAVLEPWDTAGWTKVAVLLQVAKP